MDVKTARRTLDLIETFATVGKPLGVSELARALGAPVSSCFGLVRTLEARGFLYAVSPRRGFYPTKRLLQQAQAIAARDPIADHVGPVLAVLRDETGETVLFGKLQQGQAIYLDIVESRQSIRYTARAGDLKPLHASAMGKALLASLSDAERDRLLDEIELVPVTPATITDRARLLAHLDEGRRRGWQMTRSENVGDVMALAVTVPLGSEPYGIAVAGPVHRMEPALERHAAALQAAREQLESRRDPP
ncbi:MAG: IclR family transcriptional regulator [Pseudomonadota bacterium]|nr:IclR family transcriptional regulator [Pseudomonadota bacterium]